MPITPNRNRFEAPLVNCTETDNAMDVLPAACMRRGQPVHETRELAVYLRGDDEMPMIGHHAVRKKRNVEALDGLLEQVFKREVIPSVMEKKRAFCGSIQYVKRHPGCAFPTSSRHCDDRQGNLDAGRGRSTVLNK